MGIKIDWRGPFLLLMVVMGGYGTIKFLNAKDGAAWIQCIWSVIAVFLAVIAPQWQARVDANERHRRQMKLLGEIVTMADGLMLEAEEGAMDLKSAEKASENISASKFEAVRYALVNFPVEVLYDAKEARDLMMVRAMMVESTNKLKAPRLPIGSHAERIKDFGETLAEIRDLRHETRGAIKALKAGCKH